MKTLSRLYWTAFLGWRVRGQARYAFRPPEAVRRDQCRRVRRMVAYAWRHVPYYRRTLERLGRTPADFRAVEDLERLPLIEREDLARNPMEFVSTEHPPDRHLLLHSGGSTGRPVDVYLDTRGLFEQAACFERLRAIVARCVGRRYGYREAVFASPQGTAPLVRRFCHERAWFPARARIHRRLIDLFLPIEEHLARLEEFRPDVLYGQGSTLGRLFAHARETGAPFHPPKAIIYTSDDIPGSMRRLILDEFHTPVFSLYGAVEALIVGFECEQHRGIHVNTDCCPVRIVDDAGRTLPPGETGDVVVSNLANWGTVLLNYRLGDLAALLPEPCPCGRSLPLLSFPQGRRDDRLLLPSGRTLHPQALRGPLEALDGVREYQVVQESPTLLRVALLLARSADRDRIAEAVRSRFAEICGPNVTTNVQFVDAIERTALGKTRLIVTKVAMPRPGLRQGPGASRLERRGG